MDVPVVQQHLAALCAGFNQPLVPHKREPTLLKVSPFTPQPCPDKSNPFLMQAFLGTEEQVKCFVASLYCRDFHDVLKTEHLDVSFTEEEGRGRWTGRRPSDHYVKRFRLALLRYLKRPGHPLINAMQQKEDRDALIRALLISPEEYDAAAAEPPASSGQKPKWRIQQFLAAMRGVATLPPGNEWSLIVSDYSTLHQFLNPHC